MQYRRLFAVLVLLFSSGSFAQSLRVATKVSPPFSMKNEDGKWYGLSIELWERIAKSEGWTYTFEEHSLTDMLDGVAKGEFDVAIGALTVTPERERLFEFSHSYLQVGYAIALKQQESNSVFNLLAGVASPVFLRVIFGLIGLLVLAGSLIWVFERKVNKDHFGGSWLKGIANGTWWAAVTMTTVGYGDRAPVSLGGRIVAGIWMFGSIILISTFTATVAASLTVKNIQGGVQKMNDLTPFRVGTLKNSGSEAYLRQRGIEKLAYFNNVDEALDALVVGKIKAVVYNEAMLNFYLRQEKFQEALQLIPAVRQQEIMAFGLKPNSSIRKRVNLSLLKELQAPTWTQALQTYINNP
jgi:polar amino acid transport system substrate-binding protein